MNTARGPCLDFSDMGTSALGHFPSFLVSAIIPNPAPPSASGTVDADTSNVNTCGSDGDNGLHHVVRSGDLAAANALVDAGIDVNKAVILVIRLCMLPACKAISKWSSSWSLEAQIYLPWMMAYHRLRPRERRDKTIYAIS